PQGLAAHLDGVRPCEAPLAEEDVHAQLGVTMYRIVLADNGPQLPQTRHRGSEVVVHVALDPDAERRRVADLRAGARGPDEGLRGDAPDVEAVAAQQVLFDQGDAGAQPSRAGGRHEAG